MKLSADFTLEVELSLTGMLASAEPDVGIMSDGVEDVDIEAVSVSRSRYVYDQVGGGRRVIKTVSFDLLKGLDAVARATIISNLIEAIDLDGATDALMADRP